MNTDGSCVPDPNGGPNALGAAFYDGPSGTTNLGDPAGQGGTNTITRAELGAIDQALAHAGPRPGTLTLFTDSLASLHLIIWIASTSPASLWGCKHRDLLSSITDRLVARSSLGLPTHLRTLVFAGTSWRIRGPPLPSRQLPHMPLQLPLQTTPSFPSRLGHTLLRTTQPVPAPSTAPFPTSHRPRLRSDPPLHEALPRNEFHPRPHRHPGQGPPIERSGHGATKNTQM
jgi:hypothetical protein